MKIIKISSVPQNRLPICGSWCKLLAMNTHDVKKLTGFTDRQLDYLLKVIDVLQRGKTQGKAREYSGGDAALLKTIANLRESGVSIRDINKLLNMISENPGKRAAIAIYPMKNKKPMVKLELNVNDKEINTQIGTDPEVLFLFENKWLSPDYDSEGFIMESIHRDKNQMELDLKDESELPIEE